MISLGKSAHCTDFVCDNLTVNNPTSSSHKILGPALNQGSLHHTGSIFYMKWSTIHQVTSVRTYVGDSGIPDNAVEIALSADHLLSGGDTFAIGDLPYTIAGPTTEIDGIPASEIVGTHTVHSIPADNRLRFLTTSNATFASLHTTIIPLLSITRYKYLDMHGSGVAWQHSTTEPTSSFTNTERFIISSS